MEADKLIFVVVPVSGLLNKDSRKFHEKTDQAVIFDFL